MTSTSRRKHHAAMSKPSSSVSRLLLQMKTVRSIYPRMTSSSSDSTINDNSNVMDINNFISIMLTLITLCLTCSAIIPYVVAKFISESKIKDTIEDVYAKDKERTDRQYHRSVEKLEVAEAHISRMIAYNLKKMDSIRKGIIMTPHASYDYSEHAVWTIGWASKALIRYIRNANANNVRPNEVSKFCAECISYI